MKHIGRFGSSPSHKVQGEVVTASMPIFTSLVFSDITIAIPHIHTDLRVKASSVSWELSFAEEQCAHWRICKCDTLPCLMCSLVRQVEPTDWRAKRDDLRGNINLPRSFTCGELCSCSAFWRSSGWEAQAQANAQATLNLTMEQGCYIFDTTVNMESHHHFHHHASWRQFQ